MKTLIAFGFISTVSALAQGTFNASNNYTVPGASTKALIFVVEGIPLAKSVGRVAVQNATDGSFLSPNGAAGVALTLDGLFFINGLTVPDVAPGGTAHVIVRAWDASTGPNWFDALVRSNPGSGLVTVNNLGGGLTPAASFAADSNFTGLTFFVPEPSTVALTALGVAGIFFVARRKN